MNIVYLDSYDLNPGSFEESAAHGLKEFEGLLPKLAEKAFILIDDTPKTRQIVGNITFPAYLEEVDRHIALYGRLPGKGELILKSIDVLSFTSTRCVYLTFLRFKYVLFASLLVFTSLLVEKGIWMKLISIRLY